MLEDAGHHHQGEGAGHQLSKHHEALDHPVGKELQPQGQQHADDHQGDHVAQEHPQGQHHHMIRLAHTGEGGTDGRVGKHHDDAGDEHAEGHGEEAAHGAQGQVFVIPLVQHGQADGDVEGDGRGAHEADGDDHREQIRALADLGGQGEGTAVRRHDDRGGYHRISAKEGEYRPEHLGDEDFQEGNRGHQPANGDEHVRHGVQAVLKGPAQLRLVIDNVGDSADDTAGHHEIGNERSDEFHGLPLLPVSRPAGSGCGKSWGRPGRSMPEPHGCGRTPSRSPRPCRSRSEPATR